MTGTNGSDHINREVTALKDSHSVYSGQKKSAGSMATNLNRFHCRYLLSRCIRLQRESPTGLRGIQNSASS